MYGSMKDNAGLGLFFVKEIAVRGGGSFGLASGNALIERWSVKGYQRTSRRTVTPKGGWHGTCAVVRLRRGDIADFSGMLELLRRISANVRDDPYIQAIDYIDELNVSAPDTDVIPVSDFLENVEEAAKVRDMRVIPGLQVGRTVVLDFSGINVITQSFAHALFYVILRRLLHVRFSLSLYQCSDAVKAAVTAVASYARTPDKNS
jgi:hypothetical protein